MGQFLRDQKLQNLNIDEAALDSLNAVFVARVTAKNAQLLPPQVQQAAPQAAAATQPGGPGAPPNPAQVLQKVAFPSYVIRFDDKGYRFMNFADVKQHYIDANEVERVIFMVDSGEHRQTSGFYGTQLELRLDARDGNACYLTVTADDKQWVDATFTALMDVLAKQRNASGWMRTPWTGALVQLFGVFVGLLFSVWAALIIAPNLSIDNAFAVSFIFALLIYSNVWGYLNAQILRLLDLAFPNLRFKRKEKEGYRWLIRGVVVGLLVAFGLYILKQFLSLVGYLLSSLLK
jgi:hypothetical protein